jgi:spore maturation protein SpmA
MNQIIQYEVREWLDILDNEDYGSCNLDSVLPLQHLEHSTQRLLIHNLFTLVSRCPHRIKVLVFIVHEVSLDLAPRHESPIRVPLRVNDIVLVMIPQLLCSRLSECSRYVAICIYLSICINLGLLGIIHLWAAAFMVLHRLAISHSLAILVLPIYSHRLIMLK